MTFQPTILRRLRLAGFLAVMALGLTLGAGSGPTGRKGRVAGDLPQGTLSGMRDSIESVLARHAVGHSDLKVWRVQGGEGRIFRFAGSVSVPNDFPTLPFNRELNAALVPFGARVLATERTKARTATMHVVCDGVTIWSLSLVRQPG